MPIKLSIKNLASYALVDNCPRCSWVKHLLGYKIPYAIFPGVFSTIDSHCKKICDLHYSAFDQLPQWLHARFPGFKPFKAPHYTKMVLTLGEIETRGSTDYILEKDGELVVIDNKTAHFKDADDPLAALYDFQLNACGMALEANGHGKVKSLHLVYYDPIKLDATRLLPITNNVPSLEFEVKIRDVAIDRGLVERTAAEAVKVLSQTTAPSGAAVCKDCAQLDLILDAAATNVFK